MMFHGRLRGSRLLAVAAAGAFLFAASPAHASILFSMESVSASPGDVNVGFDVFMTNVGGPSVTVGGFSFGIVTANTDITFNQATTATVLFAYIFAGNSLFGPIVSTSGPGQSLQASDLAVTGGTLLNAGDSFSLGRVFFDVAALAGLGPFAVTWDSAPGVNSLADPGGNPITIDAFVPGVITITDVPEPGARRLALLGLIALGCFALASRRKQAVKTSDVGPPVVAASRRSGGFVKSA